ncbi:MAG: hypothetical protein QNJ54_04175 [Prochloraceae cyanobacterium]|nr:hypothetical protein [Prochloraceae cyanobacterium]
MPEDNIKNVTNKNNEQMELEANPIAGATADNQNERLRYDRLEEIVEQMGEAVIATTQTVERLAERIDTLAIVVQDQTDRLQQQGYQVFALSEALEALVENQSDSKSQIKELTEALRSFVIAVKTANQK